MNHYERYMSMVRGEAVDIIPRIPILMHFAARYAGITYAEFASDPDAMVAANVKLVEDFGFEQLDVMSDPYREATAFGAGVVYREDGPPYCPNPPLKEARNLSQLKAFDIASTSRIQDCLQVLAGYKAYGYQRYSITGWVEGPAASAANLRGVEMFLMDFYEDEVFLCELLDTVLEGGIHYAEAQVAAGADTIGVGDAIASQLSPDLYAHFIAPREKKLVDAIHAAGAVARLHICGNITHLLPAMSTLGFDIVDLDWMVDMAGARHALGASTALSGNLNPVEEVLGGTPESIHTAYQNLYASVGAPYFVNAGCEIPAATPHENLGALCRPIPAG